MADTKITALTALTAADPANDVIPIVDISDTSMAASGTTKKISVNNILGASGTATLASATITGDLTAARLIVTGGTIPANGLWLPTTNTLEFAANTLAQYRIAPLGVFSWYDGAGGTRMTLNATGLGIGGPAVSRLTLGADTNTDGSNKFTFYRGGTSGQYSVIENTGGTVYRSYGTGGHFFYINNGTTEAFRVDTSGNVGIANGNLVMTTSGKGIDFSATTSGSGTMTSELLNDYEEGTWTIQLAFGGLSTGITASTNQGKYTKVGRQVTVTGYLGLTNKGSATGNATITGLPFPIANSAENYSAASLWLAAITPTAGGSANQGLGIGNTSIINLSTYKTDGSYSNLTDANFANNSEIALSFTYFA